MPNKHKSRTHADRVQSIVDISYNSENCVVCPTFGFA